MNTKIEFASSSSKIDGPGYSILGVPYDRTSSFRPSSRKAPDQIRKASYCFEPYMWEYDTSLSDIPIIDRGDLQISNEYKEMKRELGRTAGKILSKDRFPILLGGEHSITPVVVSKLKEKHEDLNVLILDAHLDFRDRYEGMKHSHATVSRRVSEKIDPANTYVYGVRSKARDYGSEDTPVYFDRDEISYKEGSSVSDQLKDILYPLYLSIDMDVFDPSYAPGVGNPEPFGLSSSHVKKLVSEISDRLVGMDIVEVCPKFDSGEITSNLAARLVYELIGSREC